MAPAAKATIMVQKTTPRLNQNKILVTITPRATKPPIARILRRKEKSFLVVKAVKVRPPNNSAVIIPAVGITSGELKFAAIYSKGKKMTASATTYRPSPRYCS